MKYLIYFFFLILLFSCNKEVKKQVDLSKAANIKVEKVDFEGLNALLNKKTDSTYVVNFWATWCQPCVEELPYFEKIYQEYKDQKVKLVLVSLDFPKQLDKSLKPFIVKNKLKGKVVLMTDPYQNKWIPNVDTSWTGSLPATLIYNTNKRQFYERTFNYKELETELIQILKTK